MDPIQAAEDFCLAYRKGPRAKRLLVEALRASVVSSQEGASGAAGAEEWVEIEGPHEVEIDLRRV